jgi:hypothetical protein
MSNILGTSKATTYKRFNVGEYMKRQRLGWFAVEEKSRATYTTSQKIKRLDEKVRYVYISVLLVSLVNIYRVSDFIVWSLNWFKYIYTCILIPLEIVFHLVMLINYSRTIARLKFFVVFKYIPFTLANGVFYITFKLIIYNYLSTLQYSILKPTLQG